jgi:integrase
MTMETALITKNDQAAIELVTNALTSEHSKRAYSKALTDFLKWRNGRDINKALVNEYRQTLSGSPASINLRMSAIRKLATEGADNGLLDQTIANGIKRVQGVKTHGVRVGNWLTKRQAQEILNAPVLQDPPDPLDATHATHENGIALLKGYRDRAILAVMIGAGLRRSEVAQLTTDHIKQRESRWVIVDLVGKGNRVRSVPIAPWVKQAIDEWLELAQIKTGSVFHAIHRAGHISHESMTPQAIRDVVKYYGKAIGMSELAAHDLRRTYAKLAHKGGAGIDQIQLSLGHSSLKITETYLGVTQNLADAPGDHLGLTIGTD